MYPIIQRLKQRKIVQWALALLPEIRPLHPLALVRSVALTLHSCTKVRDTVRTSEFEQN
jgi:hypothetical protein